MLDSAPEQDFKYTRTTLKKIELIFKEASFKVRYEKGNFQSGYCILEDHQIAVVNKFFDVEARTLCLLEILERSDMNLSQLTEPSVHLLKKLIKAFHLNIELGDDDARAPSDKLEEPSEAVT